MNQKANVNILVVEDDQDVKEIFLGDLSEEMLAVCHEPEPILFGEVRALAEIENNHTKYGMDKCKGNKQKAVALLGINRNSICSKLEI